MSKFFGIGWAKTGTTTLGRCFELLGYNHQTQDLSLVADVGRQDLTRILSVCETKETFEDWPWIILYKQLDSTFPNSRFILTKRETERWIRSYQNMLENQGEASAELNQIRRILYDLPFPNVTEAHLITRYNQHNQDVIDYFHGRPNDLLIVDWEAGDGWPELCDFIGRDIPNAPFPRLNRGNYSFLKRLTRRLKA